MSADPAFAIGETVGSGDNAAKVVQFAGRIDAPSAAPSDPGFEYIAFEVLECARGGPILANPGGWQIEMPDGGVYPSTFPGREPALLDTPLADGDCVQGWLTFEAPEGICPRYIVWAGGQFPGAVPIKWSVCP